MDVLLRAFHIPGCVKLIKPTTMTLNKGLRYHLVNFDTGFGAWSSDACSTSGSMLLSAMMNEATMFTFYTPMRATHFYIDHLQLIHF